MTDTFACLIAGSISSLHGNEILKSSIQAALPFLSIPIPLYRLSEIHSKNASPVFLYMEKPIPSVRHPAGNPPGLHQLKKLFHFLLGAFIIVILKSLSPDYHACLPAVFSIQTNKVLGAPHSAGGGIVVLSLLPPVLYRTGDKKFQTHYGYTVSHFLYDKR